MDESNPFFGFHDDPADSSQTKHALSDSGSDSDGDVFDMRSSENNERLVVEASSDYTDLNEEHLTYESPLHPLQYGQKGSDSDGDMHTVNMQIGRVTIADTPTFDTYRHTLTSSAQSEPEQSREPFSSHKVHKRGELHRQRSSSMDDVLLGRRQQSTKAAVLPAGKAMLGSMPLQRSFSDQELADLTAATDRLQPPTSTSSSSSAGGRPRVISRNATLVPSAPSPPPRRNRPSDSSEDAAAYTNPRTVYDPRQPDNVMWERHLDDREWDDDASSVGSGDIAPPHGQSQSFWDFSQQRRGLSTARAMNQAQHERSTAAVRSSAPPASSRQGAIASSADPSYKLHSMKSAAEKRKVFSRANAVDEGPRQDHVYEPVRRRDAPATSSDSESGQMMDWQMQLRHRALKPQRQVAQQRQRRQHEEKDIYDTAKAVHTYEEIFRKKKVGERLGNFFEKVAVKAHLVKVNDADWEEASDMPWYHGRCSREDAEKLLTVCGLEHGSFLVRKSPSQKSTFVISAVFRGQIVHNRVTITPRGHFMYMNSGRSFKSLEDLVNNFREVPDPKGRRLREFIPRIGEGMAQLLDF